MAKVKYHASLDRFIGEFSGVVYKKRGKTGYVARLPDFSKRKLSPAQLQSLARFREAVVHAKRILADPDARRPYEREAKKKGKTAYNAIISEYLGNKV